MITFVAQQERTADEAADNLDHRVKGEEGGQQIKDLEVKKIKMGKEEERAGQRTSRRRGRIQSRGASSWSIGGARAPVERASLVYGNIRGRPLTPGRSAMHASGLATTPPSRSVARASCPADGPPG